MTENSDIALCKLARLDLPSLRREWRRLYQSIPPQGRSRELLVRGIAWRLQETATHRLSVKTRHHLLRLTQAIGRNSDYRIGSPLRPGTVLVREWKGARYEVRVLEHGFEYCGECYRSLSHIARSITGSRWNGHIFFGLKKVGAKKKSP